MEVKATTDKAVLLRFDDGEERWIPRSQIGTEPDEDFSRGDEIEALLIKSWFAKKEGFSQL